VSNRFVRMIILLCSTDKDIVDRYMDELYEVTNETHDSETDGYGLADLNKLFWRGFCAPCDELLSVVDELSGNFSEFIDFVSHGELRDEAMRRGKEGDGTICGSFVSWVSLVTS